MLYKVRHILLKGSALLFVLLNCGMVFGAEKNVGTDETVNNLTISNDEGNFETLNINGGTANSTTVNSGGTVNIDLNGRAVDTEVNSGGTINITNGTAQNLTINEGGEVSATSSNANIDVLVIEEDGSFTFSTDATVTNAEIEGQTGSISGKTAQNILINEDSTLVVNDGGTANNITVNEDGTLLINSGGTANTVTVEEDGKIKATSGSATIDNLTIKDGGAFDVSTNVTISNWKDQNSNSLGSISANAANNVIIKEDSSLTVTSSGSASGTNVQGGTFKVSGGTAQNTTISDGGSMNVGSLATVQTVTVNGEGSIYVEGGSTVNGATLSGTNEDEKAIITISDSGVASGTTLNAYSEMDLQTSGNAQNTTVGNKGLMNVNGGTADGITVNSGGSLKADSGSIDHVSIQNGGVFDISTDTNVNNLTDATSSSLGTVQDKKAQDFVVIEGSTLTVKTDGQAINTTVKEGGTIKTDGSNTTLTGLIIEEGGKFDLTTEDTVTGMNNNGTLGGSIEEGVANNIKVTSGSTLTAVNGGSITNSGAVGGTIIVDNGSADSITVGDGGVIKATSNSATVTNAIITSSGSFDFSTDATVSATLYDSQGIHIENNTAENVRINNNSKLTVNSGGKASHSVVDNGGTLIVNNGGLAEDSMVGGGELQVVGGQASQAKISGTGVANITGNGYINESSVFDGGVINLNNGSSYSAVVSQNGTLNVLENSSANDTYINKDGTVNVENKGSFIGGTINENGNLIVKSGGSSKDTVVEKDGIITTRSGANVENLTAKADSVINIASGTTFGGSLDMDVLANASSSGYNFGNLLAADNETLESLSLRGGVNAVFNNNLVNLNTTQDKGLNLIKGDYIFSDSGNAGTVKVGGWNTISLSEANVRLESDLNMNGSEKNFSIDESSTLDVSGTLDNVLNVSLSGNIINNGTIDFAKQGDSSQDIFTINGNYTGVNANIVMNINPKENSSDRLVVNGDVEGKTSVYMKSNSGRVPQDNLLFAEATGNAEADAFRIWRVDGSPFNWETLFTDNKWYGYVTDADRPTIVPETAAYYGLIDNTFMQTASLGANLRRNLVENELHKVPCKVPSNLKYTNRICRSERPIFAGWLAPVYSSSTIQAPYNYTASITGFDGGLDLIGDGFAKIGLLGSYRNGIYKYEDGGTTYALKNEAETTINSYLAGAYLRIDGTSWSVLAAGYGGILDADISTDDGVGADTTGSTFGATLDINYIYQNISGIRIEPGVRISYTSVALDEVEDNAGKTQEFDKASRTEIEAGIKLAKRWDFYDAKAEIYVRPSVVKTINNSSEFELIEERLLESTEDRLFTKIEAGMLFDMIGNWSASLAGSYSFGSDYENSTAGMNIIYNF